MSRHLLLLLPLLLLTACPGARQTRRSTKVQGPRFALASQNGCQRFVDRRGSLGFCVSPSSSMTPLKQTMTGRVRPFEVRISTSVPGLVVYLRRDKLPQEMPEGALSGPWSQRYLEGYIRRRGTPRNRSTTRILHRQRTRYLKADVAVWGSFPLSSDPAYVWEEVLVLVKRPRTRYLLSLRMTAQTRKQPQQLKQFFSNLLRSLRFQTDPS